MTPSVYHRTSARFRVFKGMIVGTNRSTDVVASVGTATAWLVRNVLNK